MRAMLLILLLVLPAACREGADKGAGPLLTEAQAGAVDLTSAYVTVEIRLPHALGVGEGQVFAFQADGHSKDLRQLLEVGGRTYGVYVYLDGSGRLLVAIKPRAVSPREGDFVAYRSRGVRFSTTEDQALSEAHGLRGNHWNDAIIRAELVERVVHEHHHGHHHGH